MTHKEHRSPQISETARANDLPAPKKMSSPRKKDRVNEETSSRGAMEFDRQCLNTSFGVLGFKSL